MMVVTLPSCKISSFTTLPLDKWFIAIDAQHIRLGKDWRTYNYCPHFKNKKIDRKFKRFSCGDRSRKWQNWDLNLGLLTVISFFCYTTSAVIFLKWTFNYERAFQSKLLTMNTKLLMANALEIKLPIS